MTDCGEWYLLAPADVEAEDAWVVTRVCRLLGDVRLVHFALEVSGVA